MSVTGLRFAGTRALLVELSSLDSVLALHAHLLGSPLPGQIDVLAAASTVLIKCDTRAHALKARAAVERLELGAAPAASGEIVEIPVNYDGEDLAEVARLAGLSPEGVVNAHIGQLWTAAFGGFAPGFAYLVGEDHVLDVPRRDTPRTAVPAGAVALAGGYSAVYPRKSPGGWQLIGHTSTVMWDLERANPALIRPQDRVRFVPARESIAARSETAALNAPPHTEDIQQEHGITQQQPVSQSAAQTAAEPQAAKQSGTAGSSLEVVSPGLRSLLQDLGRPGLGDLGVSASGAVDPSAARQANRLAGNGSGDAVIENLFGSLVLRARGDQVLAVTGARVELTINPSGRRPAQDAPFALLDGETLALGPATTGLQAYVAVRGGIEVEPVLGSRSTDTMSGLGPAPLAAGSVLPIGQTTNRHVVGTPEPSALRVAPGEAATLRITAGPRDDWFGAAGLERLTGQKWLASSASDRIGLRLELPDGAKGSAAPASLARIREGELKSEGVVAGSLQVPPSGLPVLFLADHPVTGGYPVIAAVVPEDLPVAAQLPPGTTIRFVLVDPDTLQATGTAGATTSLEGPRP
ncbi:carboxyltransferase domain-containing protein [Arthrobacter crystallopoietes]|uniref:Sensor histidine kinase inhibitor, KipI family n=1 Tax=Crystallibacter crystallopoietes TaxID=37928 RepID=A0A1H1CZV2_9MICC|nr:carboxyltransferase domain-containing protein [Arthrobacter crystallopoietes]AUI50530.1 urea amidolyase [Arthrobacter crystallopoietes]SDQ69559.1 sensor histidine kinase inhibitor, KipI family [Arthrobacter crystallopoietes]